MELTEENC